MKLAYSINYEGTSYVELSENRKEVDIWTGGAPRKFRSVKLDSTTINNKYYGLARSQDGFAITSQSKSEIHLVFYSWKGKEKESITLTIPESYITGRPSFKGVSRINDTLILATMYNNCYFFYESKFVKMKANVGLDSKKGQIYFQDSIFKKDNWIINHLGELKKWHIYNGNVYAQNKKRQNFIYNLKNETVSVLNHQFISSIKFGRGEVFCQGDSIYVQVGNVPNSRK